MREFTVYRFPFTRHRSAAALAASGRVRMCCLVHRGHARMTVNRNDEPSPAPVTRRTANSQLPPSVRSRLTRSNAAWVAWNFTIARPPANA